MALVELEAPAARAAVARARSARRSRSALVSIALTVAIAAVFALCVSVGDFPIPLSDVVPAIFGLGTPDADFIVHELRLPRALAGLIVGVAFGISGAIFQTIARNPLASPDILGVTAGASTAAVLAITVIGASWALLSVCAFVGALATAFAMYLLVYRQGVSTYRFILVGIGVGAMAAAATEYLLTRASLNDAATATAWLVGSLNARGWETVMPTGLGLLVLLPAVFALAGSLRGLQLGDDTAKGLGVRVEPARLGLVVVAVALAAVGTVVAGPVAFVAFVSPAIARALTRSPGPALAASALTGAVLVLVSDLVGRRLFAPVEIPVGIVTGIVGAAYFIVVLTRSNRVGSGG